MRFLQQKNYSFILFSTLFSLEGSHYAQATLLECAVMFQLLEECGWHNKASQRYPSPELQNLSLYIVKRKQSSNGFKIASKLT